MNNMNEFLKQTDWEDLWAYRDQQLPEQRASQIRQLLATNPHWQAAYREIDRLDNLLDTYQPPPVDGDLPDRIISFVRRSRWTEVAGRVFSLAAPLTAAAAILIAILLTGVEKRRPMEPSAGPSAFAAGQAAVEPFVVTNLDFFQDMDVAANLETIQEIEKLESPRVGI